MTNPRQYGREYGGNTEGILERSLTSRQLSTSAWSATTAPRFRELIEVLILRRPRSGRLEGWTRLEIGAPWFETRFALLTMRV
jgi:hypothetical protein